MALSSGAELHTSDSDVLIKQDAPGGLGKHKAAKQGVVNRWYDSDTDALPSRLPAASSTDDTDNGDPTVAMPFAAFVKKYRILAYPILQPVDPTGESCATICRHIGLDTVTIGDTKITLTPHQSSLLEDRLKRIDDKWSKVQAAARGFLHRRQYQVLKANRKTDDVTFNTLRSIITGDYVSGSGAYSKPAVGYQVNHLNHTASVTNSRSSLNEKPTTDSLRTLTREREAALERQRAKRGHGRCSSVISDTTVTTGTTDAIDNGKESWDLFRSMATGDKRFYEYRNTGFDIAAEVLKGIAFLFIFLMVLAAAVVSKGSLLLMADSISTRQMTHLKGMWFRDRWVYMVIFAVIAPYVLTVCESTFRCMFGHRPWPSLGNVLWTIFIETLHTFGVCLLLFRVLPCIDPIRALLVMNAFMALPSIFRLLTTKRIEEPRRRLATIVLDFFAALMQLSAFVIVVLSMATDCQAKSHVNGVDKNSEATANSVTNLKFSSVSWELPVAMFLIATCWWENFVDKDLRIFMFEIPLKQYKDSLHRTRTKSYIIASIWKIALMFGFAFLLVPRLSMAHVAFGDVMVLRNYTNATGIPITVDLPITTTEPTTVEFGLVQQTVSRTTPALRPLTTTPAPDFAHQGLVLHTMNCSLATHNLTVCDFTYVDPWRYFTTYIPFIVHVLASVICYYFARLACKLCMQRFAFALPLCLATPASVAVILGLCHANTAQMPPPLASMFQWWCGDAMDSQWFVWHLGLGFGLWWVSQLWITRYIWTPRASRLSFTERLFLLPAYCSAIIEQSLLLNRRRNDKEKILKELIYIHDDNTSLGSGSTDTQKSKVREHIVPRIFICATMWHETAEEMKQVLKSIIRMDIDQSARRNAQDYFNIQDPDYYEFEAHIFLDDAMGYNNAHQWMPNMFVRQLMATIDAAAKEVHNAEISLHHPLRVPTPYGGRLVWTLPGGNQVFAHFKDAAKVRHKKRWSQVMYMYYLLGYRLLSQHEDTALNNSLYSEKPEKWKSQQHFVRGSLFKHLPERILTQSENTFILALDGDVNFKPEAVQLLSDRMRKNKKVGAACGRIHPIGSGPIVWYQVFEYAVGHWLLKAAEHMLGCVLCSPGCFSLFRASALMDDNVMRNYATQSSMARHYLQYDQGEDRWLSTLLLQKGYRVEYCAAADAHTHCPESFNEFFNQRRRWVPSTLANIVDLLQSYKTTVKCNDNISYMYIAYQGMLLLSTVLGPATILLMMAGAFNAVMRIYLWQAYLIAIGPAILFLLSCFVTKVSFQLSFAAILSAAYSLLMMAVIVGTVVQIAEDTVVSPNAIFLLILLGIFILSAVFHPQEILCLIPGALYFLCIPSGYVLLIIYSICNLNIVSWGTREISRPTETDAPTTKETTISNRITTWFSDEKESCCGSLVNFFKRHCGGRSHDRTADVLKQIAEKLDRLEQGLKTATEAQHTPHFRRRSASSRRSSRRSVKGIEEEEQANDADSDSSTTSAEGTEPHEEERDDLVNPRWMEDPSLNRGKVQFLQQREIDFWQKFIAKYLYAVEPDKQQLAKIKGDLKSMRDNVSFAFFMVNAFWMIIMFMLQNVKDRVSILIPRPNSDPLPVEPLGLVFIVVFAFILLLQFFSMLRHRYGTLLHIIASTELRFCRKRYDARKHVMAAVEYAMRLQSLYGFEDDADTTDQETFQLRHTRQRRQNPLNDLCDDSSLRTPSTRSDTNGDLSDVSRSDGPNMFENPAYRFSVAAQIHNGKPFMETSTPVDPIPAHLQAHSKRKQKKNTLRRAFIRRYTKIMKQQSVEASAGTSVNGWRPPPVPPQTDRPFHLKSISSAASSSEADAKYNKPS